MAVGDVMEIEDDFLDISPFRRVRVWVDITKPLKRFQMIRLKGNNMAKISLKYERLPHFCFLCGFMSHTKKDCTNVPEEDREGGYKWSLDICASPRKGLNRNKDEEEFFKRRQCLFTPKPSCVDKGMSLAVEDKIPESLTHANTVEASEQAVGVENDHEAGGSVHEMALPVRDKEPRLDEINTACTNVVNMQNPPKDIVGVKEVDPTTNFSGGSPYVVEADSSEGIKCPPFQVGYFEAAPKKSHKIKRRAHALNDAGHATTSGTDTSVLPSLCVDKDSSGKRKSDDIDVDIYVGDCELKRSCLGYGVTSVLSCVDILAGVGDDQPREEQ